MRAAEGPADAGGKPGSTSAIRPSLGVKAQAAEGGAQLQFVFSGGAAQQAGLSAGDVIIAVDGLRVTAVTLDKVVANRQPGDVMEVHAFRRDELLVFRVTVGQAPLDTCVLQMPEEAAARHQVENWVLGR